MLTDQNQRQQATDPRQSFIVQAPAGSGKTELLTQRYLRLLGTVNEPEQIVALTFTRKAASEMRERILHALTKAQQKENPTSPHQQLTYDYATTALQRADQRGWQILKQPARLKIITIDALCQSLTRAIPVHEQQTPYADISDKPLALYLQAARACFTEAIDTSDFQHAVKLLLAHLDNRQDKLLELFCDLLRTREQWLAILYTARQQTQGDYEQALALIEEHEFERFYNSIPLELQYELCQLCSEVVALENNSESSRFLLRDWCQFKELNRETAASLGAMLLTTTHTLRKSFDHHVGFKKGICDDNLYKNLKGQSQILLAKLGECNDFLNALKRISKLPAPYYEPEQWQVLQAVLTLLPLLAAHLQIVFRDNNEVDFTAISQQALFALGNDEEPTDLALYLDNSIHHLLIDEFQDTSIQQFQLLTRLVQGWLPDDGRTLFIVGDPMQSIYRFRQAEVGLFLKAKYEGIGDVKLTPLELCCNFRSNTPIVDWVNKQFKLIFPEQNDMESGAISFYPAVNVLTKSENSSINALSCTTKQHEAEVLVGIVEQQLADYPDNTIAILVRSRSQLSHIVPLLRQKNIPFQGVEIEKLADLSHLRDIWSITRALLMPADRLSWLILLRSPWCGLSLGDLHCIANFDRKKSIFHALAHLEKLDGLTAEGLVRSQYIYAVLHNALACRHQHSLVDWLRNTFRHLQEDNILISTEQADLEQFWLLITRYEMDGIIADWQQFESEFKQLFSQRVTPAQLQIMTIHKSKGLEFDCVILPGLGKKPSIRDKPLLRWLRLPVHQQEELLLLSPVRAAHDEQCLLYDYLGELDKDKDRYEQQRLLYVAATRAKKRLYLLDSQEKTATGTFRELLQHQPFIHDDKIDVVDELSNLPPLKHLPVDCYRTCPALILTTSNGLAPITLDNKTRVIGTITHELLQWICDNHPYDMSDLPWSMIENRFKSEGFSLDDLQEAMSLLRSQITAMLSCETGQWLCQKHSNEQNEYELLMLDNGNLATRIIDRTFVDQGERWVIDFKTGKEDERAQSAHQKQVNGYAELLASQSELPVRCGVYYLATGKWLEWRLE